MTTTSGKPDATAEAQQSAIIMRQLRLSVFLVSLPFGMLLFGLPLIARELGVSALAICENKCKEKTKCHHQRT